MPSFDIVSTVNLQEIENAVHQAQKEVATRYDFRGSKSMIEWDKKSLRLIADDDFKMKALLDIVLSKVIKRGVDSKALDQGKVEPAAGGLVKCEVKLKQGIPTESAKEITRAIKDSKLKIQAQIQDEQVRISGKKKDDLQEAIAFIRGKNFNLPLQFINFRD